MIPITKPYLTIEIDKLYISRKPGIISWLLFALSIAVFTALFRCLTNGIFVLTIFILGEIVFGLDVFGEWEELMLDKTRNLVTLTKYSWYDKFFSKKYILRMKLSDIRHVGVSQNMGLFMLSRNGKAVTFSTRGSRRDEVEKIKRDINFFLNSIRDETMKRNSPNPGDFSKVSDSDEYLQSLLDKCSRDLTLQEVLFSTSMLNGQKAKQIQSSPILHNNTTDRSSEKFPKKRPYGINKIGSLRDDDSKFYYTFCTDLSSS